MTEWLGSPAGAIARRLMRSLDFGVLSSMSSELPGYPFGSVTPYVLTHAGRPAIYVSTIAQHTTNMKLDSRACLTVAEQARGNQQALGRVSLVGDGMRVPQAALDEVSERYFAFHPEARQYGSAHAFDFFWLEPKRVRYIGGFGKIYWVELEEWLVPRPSWADQEGAILEHMHADHSEALLRMASRQRGRPVASAQMLACDVEGCHLLVDGAIEYIPFAGPCMSLAEVRAALVELARASS